MIVCEEGNDTKIFYLPDIFNIVLSFTHITYSNTMTLNFKPYSAYLFQIIFNAVVRKYYAL